MCACYLGNWDVRVCGCVHGCVCVWECVQEIEARLVENLKRVKLFELTNLLGPNDRLTDAASVDFVLKKEN